MTRARKAPVRPAPEGWTLVWHDEFDGDQIDRSKWDFDIGNGFFDYHSHTWVPGWGNEELQYYTDAPANAYVKDSALHICAIKESLHGCGYTSARLKTRSRDGAPLFNQTYGRFEIRAQVPWGKGLWPALWMLPQNDTHGRWAASGEIDIMEIHGEDPTRTLGSIHFGSTYPKRSLVTHTHKLPDSTTVADWHVYAVEWEPGEIRWYFDGVHWATQGFWWSCSKTRDGQGIAPSRASDLNPWPAPFDHPFYLLMNVAVGGNFPGVPNAQTQFPASLVVDYVRVYQRSTGYGESKPRATGRVPYSKPKP